eukprot:Phypoly_transcript_08592.p1 GENE.Phypoly_transcript_08592~~Phypoly_transcript_08592.p1  ORF type:complete len:347 (+),score=44.04 Phypoly_transcript_08592:148-1188(+)
MGKFSFIFLALVLFVCISAEEIHIKPGTYKDIPANPGDVIVFSAGVYILPVHFKLVQDVTYLGNSSIIQNSQSWDGTSFVTIYGFTFNGTTLNFENNDTNIQIGGNTFYSNGNSSSSTVINMFSSNTVIIANNTFIGYNEQQLGVSVAQSTDVIIANNSFVSSSIEFQIYSNEYNVNLYKTGVTVHGNCFFNVSGQAVLIFVGISGPQFNVDLTNNTIYNYHPKLPDFTRAFNLQLQDQYFTVKGNYLSPAEASGATCNFCTPIAIQVSAIQKNATISENTIGGNAWSYYVQCFANGDVVVPVQGNWFYGTVSPPVSTDCGKFPNTVGPRSSVPTPPACALIFVIT